MPARIVLSLLLASSLTACGGDAEPHAPVTADAPATTPADTTIADADPFPAFARRAMTIELALDGYRETEGQWQAGDASSVFTAHFDADTLRLIEEIQNAGEYGDATAVYYFAAGAPFYVVQDEERTRLEPGQSGRLDTIQTRAAFAPDGTVAATEQIVNGDVREAPLVEIEGMWDHARALAEEARRAGRPAL